MQLIRFWRTIKFASCFRPNEKVTGAAFHGMMSVFNLLLIPVD